MSRPGRMLVLLGRHFFDRITYIVIYLRFCEHRIQMVAMFKHFSACELRVLEWRTEGFQQSANGVENSANAQLANC